MILEAAYQGHYTTVKCLLEHKAHINAQDDGQTTALHRAVWKGHYDVADLLLKHNIDKNLRNAMGTTALHEAIRRGDTKIVELLLNYKIDIFMRDNNRRNALDFAHQMKNCPPVIVALLEHAKQEAILVTALLIGWAWHLKAKKLQERGQSSLDDSKGIK